MRHKLIFSFAVFCLINLFTYSQKYEIKVEINGISDTVIFLGHHYGDKKYVVDTTYIDHKGKAVFSGDKELEKGIYLIVMPSNNMSFFEILISDNKNFSIKTDTSNFVANIKIKGCRENRVFNEYQREMGKIQEKRMALNNKMEEYKDDVEMLEKFKEESLRINEERKEYVDKLINNNPDLFFTKILLAMKDIEVPDPPKDENGEIIDPNFRYLYFKEHYFDYIDFSERGLLRTPIFENKINYYLEKMVIPNPDSLMKETDYIIGMAYEAGDSIVFRTTASHLLRYFETSKIMGFDAVFVHIAEQWYLSGKAYWANEEFLEKLIERVTKISPTLIGNISPNLLRMQTIDDKYISLHQVNADYTILIFFEPDCGHCKKVVPALFKKYQDTLMDINVKIFAVYTQYDREEWKEFADKHEIYADGWYNVWDGPRPHSNFRNFYDIYSTPVVYLLAGDKRIVAKRIAVNDITRIIEIDKLIQEEKKKQEEEKGG